MGMILGYARKRLFIILGQKRRARLDAAWQDYEGELRVWQRFPAMLLEDLPLKKAAPLWLRFWRFLSASA